MSTITPRTTVLAGDPAERIVPRRIWQVGLLAILASVIATGLVREIGAALGTLPPTILVFQQPGVALSTIVQAGLGVIAFAVIARFARRPIRTFTIVGIIALLISFLNPVFAAMGMMPLGEPIGLDTVLTLLVMHIVAGGIIIGALTTFTRAR